MGRYDDIINLQHPTSRKYPRMVMVERAAQFSPFQALTGYASAIKETARLTDQWIELDESSKADLNEKLRIKTGRGSYWTRSSWRIYMQQ